MRVRPRRVILAVVLLLLATLTLTVAWAQNGWPPPRLILKYGFPPTGGPTGNVKTIEGIEFIELKPGYFRMGSHFLCRRGDLLGRFGAVFGLSWGTPPDHSSVECPPHWVVISRPFWIAKTEVTNAQFRRFAPRHESLPLFLRGNDQTPIGWDTGPDCPARWKSREDAKEFLSWLSKRSGLPLRLPSESEWEYACRAGSGAEYAYGDEAAALKDHEWFGLGHEDAPQPVAGKASNSWGLYDFHGNVCEWCEDAWHSSYHGAPGDESPWLDDGETFKGFEQFVLRGGQSHSDPSSCRSAVRRGEWGAGIAGGYCGFRPVFTLPEDE